MDYENDKDAEDAMEALKGKNMGGRTLNIGKYRNRWIYLFPISYSIYDDFILIIQSGVNSQITTTRKRAQGLDRKHFDIQKLIINIAMLAIKEGAILVKGKVTLRGTATDQVEGKFIFNN